MPSPIAHTAVGYAIYQVAAPILSHPARKDGWRKRDLFLASVGLSLLPDIDAIPGFLMGDLARFHNNALHSLLTGFVAALLVGALVYGARKRGWVEGFLLCLVCYELHIVLDYFTRGRGVMLFWPLTAERFTAPVNLFYGLRWSYGWFSIYHLWTFVTELGFVAGILLVLRQIRRSTRFARA